MRGVLETERGRQAHIKMEKGKWDFCQTETRNKRLKYIRDKREKKLKVEEENQS